MLANLTADIDRRAAPDPLVDELLRHWPRIMTPQHEAVSPRRAEAPPLDPARLALSWLG